MTEGMQPTGKRGRNQKRAMPPAAGLYPDPSGKDGERYWNGTEWTAKYVPMTMPISTTQRVWKWIAITAAILTFGGCTYLVLQPAEPAATHKPAPTNAAPITHGPQSHMPRPTGETPTSRTAAASACDPAPARLVEMINAGFTDGEHLEDVTALSAPRAGTYIAGNIYTENGRSLSSHNAWVYTNGAIYALTKDARKHSLFTDGRNLVPDFFSSADWELLGQCINAAARAAGK